jgi:predicted DNA-binding protein
MQRPRRRPKIRSRNTVIHSGQNVVEQLAMPISVRLDTTLEHRLTRASKKLRVNKSELIKRSLQAYLDHLEPSKTAFELGEDLFGADTTPDASLSATYKRQLKQKLRDKHHR